MGASEEVNPFRKPTAEGQDGVGLALYGPQQNKTDGPVGTASLSIFNSGPGAADDPFSQVLGQTHLASSSLRLAFVRPWYVGQVGVGRQSLIH
jgi:hypothetical protein